jgi:pimeloyl-ACP methyl ester carboxylesterase
MTGPTELRLPLATGLGLHTLEWGSAQAHTVILVHGFLDSGWAWEEVGGALGERFHVLAPDMRGHGDSDRVGAGGYYHFMDYVADLSEVARVRGKSRLSLVGHSMGGAICAYFAGSFPQRVSHLAMIEGLGVPEQPMGPDRVARWVGAWTGSGATGTGIAVGPRAPHAGYASLEEAAARLRQHDPLLDATRALRLAEHGTHLDADGRVRFKHDPLHLTPGPYGFTVANMERFLRAIACPTLLVDGGASTFVLPPDEASRRAAMIPMARRVVVPGAGHTVMRHQPDALAALLAEFLG